MLGKASDNKKAVVEEEVSEEDEKPKPKKKPVKKEADAKTSIAA
jgi:hypothetical protein